MEIVHETPSKKNQIVENALRKSEEVMAKENSQESAMKFLEELSNVKLDEGMIPKVMGELKDLVEKSAPQMPVKDLFQIPPKVLEGLYTHAYTMYNQGRYEDAGNLFRVLVMMDPEEYRFTLGLAACMHMQKLYSEAAAIYVIASMMKGSSPIPPYHASDCYLKCDDTESAITSLKMCIEAAGDQEAFQVLKQRAQLTLDALTDQKQDEAKELKAKAKSKKKVKKKTKKKS